jgi:hypothetical protein
METSLSNPKRLKPTLVISAPFLSSVRSYAGDASQWEFLGLCERWMTERAMTAERARQRRRWAQDDTGRSAERTQRLTGAVAMSEGWDWMEEK